MLRRVALTALLLAAVMLPGEGTGPTVRRGAAKQELVLDEALLK